MKTALTEQEFKAILQDAYQAGERASERNKEIDRLLDGGTKSCPAQPSFENYYQSMLAMQPIEAEKEAIEFNKYTQELPKQEERDGYADIEGFIDMYLMSFADSAIRKLLKALDEIREYQVNNFQIAKSTEVYKIADNAIKVFNELENKQCDATLINTNKAIEKVKLQMATESLDFQMKLQRRIDEQAIQIKELKAALEKTKNLFSVIEYNGKVLDEINKLLKTK